MAKRIPLSHPQLVMVLCIVFIRCDQLNTWFGSQVNISWTEAERDGVSLLFLFEETYIDAGRSPSPEDQVTATFRCMRLRPRDVYSFRI